MIIATLVMNTKRMLRYALIVILALIMDLILYGHLFAKDPLWQAPSGMQYSMTLTTVVHLNGVEVENSQTKLAAYVGEHIRGVASPIYNASLDRHIFFLTYFSTAPSGEVVTFKVYDPERDTVLNTQNQLAFQNDLQIGSPSEPYVIIDNNPPSSIALSHSSINENMASGAPIGTLATVDPDISNNHHYSLVSGDGSDDNSDFNIQSNQLFIKESPDFESKPSYSIRIRVEDNHGGFIESVFVITVIDLDESITSISEELRLSVFPNPGRGGFTVTNWSGGLAKITLISISGVQTPGTIHADGSIQFDQKTVPGIYWVKIPSGNQVYTTEKLIIK